VLGTAAGAVRAAIAIGAFAGLRNMEIFRLNWEDVNLGAGRIIVSADKAKTAQRRIVPILPNLKAWLEPLAKKEGRVCPPLANLTNLSRNISTACAAAGVEMVGNRLRHSFASYRLASVKSADQVALEMGNSPRKLFQNYRELVTPEAATAWFNVTLETLEEADENTPENVVSITKGQAA
jgi:integrase